MVSLMTSPQKGAGRQVPGERQKTMCQKNHLLPIIRGVGDESRKKARLGESAILRFFRGSGRI